MVRRLVVSTGCLQIGKAAAGGVGGRGVGWRSLGWLRPGGLGARQHGLGSGVRADGAAKGRRVAVDRSASPVGGLLWGSLECGLYVARAWARLLLRSLAHHSSSFSAADLNSLRFSATSRRSSRVMLSSRLSRPFGRSSTSPASPPAPPHAAARAAAWSHAGSRGAQSRRARRSQCRPPSGWCSSARLVLLARGVERHRVGVHVGAKGVRDGIE